MAAEAGKMAVELSMENQRLKAQIAAMQAQIEEMGGTPPAPPPPIDTSATLVPRNTELGPAANATLGSMRAPERAEEAERVGVKNPFAMGKQRADSQPAAAAKTAADGCAVGGVQECRLGGRVCQTRVALKCCQTITKWR